GAGGHGTLDGDWSTDVCSPDLLLLAAAASGLWAAALILPLYYLVDATWTLLRRAARGARVWEAHREHFYQRAVQGGLDHAAVVRSEERRGGEERRSGAWAASVC